MRDGGGGSRREGFGARGVDVVDTPSVIEGCEGLDGVTNCNYGGLVKVSWYYVKIKAWSFVETGIGVATYEEHPLWEEARMLGQIWEYSVHCFV